MKMCCVVLGDWLQEAQMSVFVMPIMCFYVLSAEQWPERSCGRVVWYSLPMSGGWRSKGPVPDGGVDVLSVQLFPDLLGDIESSICKIPQDLRVEPALYTCLLIHGPGIGRDSGIGRVFGLKGYDQEQTVEQKEVVLYREHLDLNVEMALGRDPDTPSGSA